jgi:UDP-N-acetylmuramoyl-tripeptide--D-alanyl-D-alanine ligase
VEPIAIREILQAVEGRLLGDDQDLEQTVTLVETDSRSIHPGSLFIPLTGDRFDGHAFINDALSAGAAGCFTARERESYLPGKFYIKVSGGTQKALRDRASYYKKKVEIPGIGITGSVGKTTTKDMVAAVLGEKFKVLKTEGNFNNEVGLPLTLLRLDSTCQICVLEMGMNHPGEIEYLSHIIEPDAAIITNIGDAHIEFLGNRENILKAKCEIFSHMKKDGFVVLGGDDPLLSTLRGKLPYRTVFCGLAEGLDYRATGITSDGERYLRCRIQTPVREFPAEIAALGSHMIYPALIATAVAERFGLSGEEIASGILHFAPTKMRMNILRRAEGITILNDAYNANPQSMRAALEVLAQNKGARKIAVLGDMLELGPLAPALHAGIGECLGRAGIECVVTVGEYAKYIYDAVLASPVPEVFHCATKEEAKPILSQALQPNTTVLVKASRGMAFEELVDYLNSITKEPEQI